jgi:hypothetical protein
VLGDRVDGGLHHGHGFVPFALDRGEHRVGLVRQPAGADHAHGLGDDFPDAFADAERGNRERYEHDLQG